MWTLQHVHKATAHVEGATYLSGEVCMVAMETTWLSVTGHARDAGDSLALSCGNKISSLFNNCMCNIRITL